MASFLDMFAADEDSTPQYGQQQTPQYNQQDLGFAMLSAAGALAGANRPNFWGSPSVGELLAHGAAGFGGSLQNSEAMRQQEAVQNAKLQFQQAQMLQALKKDQREAEKHNLDMQGLGLTGDARNLALMNRRMPTQEELLRFKQDNPNLSLVPINDPYGNTTYKVFNPKTGEMGPLPASGQGSSASPGNAPIGIRNNNFGNIRDDGKAWPGQAGVSGGFKVFATPEAGMQATLNNLSAYSSKHGLNTVRGIIGRWAPPNENNTNAYIANICRHMGVEPDTPLNMSDPKVKAGLGFLIARHENGADPATYADWLKVAGGQPQPQQPGGQPQSQPQQQEKFVFKPGEAFDPFGNRVTPPDGVRWEKPEEMDLQDGTRAPVQWDATRNFYRIVGQAKDPKESQRIYDSVVLEDISKAKRLAKDYMWLPNTGLGSYLSWVPATNARDLAATLETIKASIGFKRLQEMRDASPTGGALGQVSEKENALLQAALGSLEQSQSEAQFMANMDRIESTYLDIVHGEGNWRKGADGGVPLGAQPGTGAQNAAPKSPQRRRFNPQTGRIE